MATNMTFVDFLTPVPADWLNNVNAFVNFPNVTNVASLRLIPKGKVQIVNTECYSTLGDFGQGTYWYNAAAATFTLATPGSIFLGPVSAGGFLAAGTYSYRVSAYDESGYTIASASTTTNTTGSTSTITVAWGAVTGAAGYAIYGRTLGSEQLLVEVDSNHLQWTDTGGLTSGYGNPPATAWQWDNGGSRIQAADGGRYNLMNQASKYYIEQFGGSTSRSDNTAPIAAIQLAAASNGGGDIYFRAGVYNSSQIVRRTNVSFYGIGTDHSGHFQVPALTNTLGTTLRCVAGLNPGNGFMYFPIFCHSNRTVSINIDGNTAGNTQMATCYVATGYPNADFGNQSEDLYVTFYDCGITGGTNFGLYCGPAGRGGRVFNSYIYANPGDGVRCQTSDWSFGETLWGLNGNNIVFLGAAACHVFDCDIFVPQETTINATGMNVLINDSSFFGGPVPSGPLWFTNCEFDYAAEHSVGIFGTNTAQVVFDACCFNSASINHNNQYSVFGIGPSVQNGAIMVSNCQFSTGAPPNVAQYIFNFASTSTWIRTVNNHIQAGSYVTDITNSYNSLRLSTGASDTSGLGFIDGSGGVTANRLVASMTGGVAAHMLTNLVTEGGTVMQSGSGILPSISVSTVAAAGYNLLGAALFVGKNSSSSRSINAGGTINASGADYAEYMMKRDDCGVVPKGAIVGLDKDGLLTDKFDDAFSFVVKSTNPSLVGNDSWALEDQDKVDRVAFSGQVPVNITAGKPGDFIVPQRNADGTIGGIPVTDPGLTQYVLSVGRIKNFGEDGRANIIVKVA